jgi:hypothetical protein
MKKTLLSILAVLLLAGCAAASPARDFASEESVAPSFGAPAEAPMEAYAEADSGGNAFAGSQTQPQVERIVIKNANLTIAVESPAATVDTIARMAEEMGGFVVTSNLYRTTLSNGVEAPRGSITVRVPAERLNEALELIRAQSDIPPMNETTNSQDVTEDYTDLQSRLRNLEAAEAQLQKFMEDARNTEDVLAVYQQLTQVREQIEVTKGRIQYYEQSAALSSVTVEILPNAAVQPLSVGGWQPVGVARQALQALIRTLQVLVNILIYLVLLVLPVMALILVPPGLVIWGILRWRAQRKKNTAA